MPIVITRTGDGAVLASPLSPAQKNEAWKCIIGAWIEKHPDQFQALLGTEDQAS